MQTENHQNLYMEIAIIGYGKMGKEIAEIAEERGHEVSVIIDSSDDWMEKIDELRSCDIAIDFGFLWKIQRTLKMAWNII